MKMARNFLLVAMFVASLLIPAACAFAQESTKKESPKKNAAKPKKNKRKVDNSVGRRGVAAKIIPSKRIKDPLLRRLTALQKALDRHTEKASFVPTELKVLAKYLEEGDEGLTAPDTNEALLMNKAYLGKSPIVLENKAIFITFYAAGDTEDKGRAVVMADGKAKYLKGDEFTKTLEASKARELTDDENMQLRDERMEERLSNSKSRGGRRGRRGRGRRGRK